MLAATFFSATILMGCNEETPNDKLSSATVKPYAEADLVTGLELTDYIRDNGWADNQAPNRYIVQYKFNYRLTMPLPNTVLGFAKEIKAELDEKTKNPGFMGLDGMQAKLASSTSAAQWIAAQGDKFAIRRDNFLGGCAECISYWNGEISENERQERKESFILAWAYFENLGFPDKATTGEKIPREAWAAFSKTEKGWAAAK